MSTTDKIYHTVTRVRVHDRSAVAVTGPQLAIRCSCGFERIAARLSTAGRRKAENEMAAHILEQTRAELIALNVGHTPLASSFQAIRCIGDGIKALGAEA